MAKQKKQSSLPPAANDHRLSLDDLIRRQKVKPVTDLDKLGSLWPAAHDPDAFEVFLQRERAARRTEKPRRKTA